MGTDVVFEWGDAASKAGRDARESLPGNGAPIRARTFFSGGLAPRENAPLRPDRGKSRPPANRPSETEFRRRAL